MSDPAFTVLIKAYNEEEFIGAAIRSALAQTRGDFELVVVDDGSTDGTAEVVEGFRSRDPRVRLVSQPNRGVAAAWNAGVEAARAPYVALLDADDLWMPTFLERTGAALDADPNAGFAYTDAWRLQQDNGRFLRAGYVETRGLRGDPPADPHELLRRLLRANFILSLATVRRSAIEAVGGFNPARTAAGDYELWIRILARGLRAAWVPGRLAVRRDRSGSVSKSQRRNMTNILDICRIVVEELDVPEDVKEAARRRAADLERYLAALDGRRRGKSARLALRRGIGRVGKRVMPRRVWYPRTPPEVSAAFPELARDA